MKPLEAPEVHIYKGQEHIITLPSTRVVKMRETNGNDDETLSRLGDNAQGLAQYNFLADITIEESFTKGKPTVDNVLEWPINDIYYTLFKQRLINHGTTLGFTYECPNGDCTDKEGGRTVTDYEQDLTEFDRDLKNYKPNPKEKVNPKQRITPYPELAKAIVDFKTSSGKQYRFKLLNGVLERRQLDTPQAELNQNTRLLLRELETYIEGQWIRLTTFHAIPSKEMGEIRGNIERLDPIFDPAVKCTCPKCKLRFDVGLFTIPSFYFPAPKM